MTKVDEIVDQIRPMLVAGLDGERAAWAEAGYRRWVLPPWLQGDHAEVVGPMLVKDLTAELESTPPSERWSFIRSKVLVSRLTPATQEAFLLAEAVARAGQSTPEQRHRAEEILREIEEISAEASTRQESPEEVRLELGEAELDCRYVIDGGELTSLRLATALDGGGGGRL